MWSCGTIKVHLGLYFISTCKDGKTRTFVKVSEKTYNIETAHGTCV
jgi:hypothetical protein